MKYQTDANFVQVLSFRHLNCNGSFATRRFVSQTAICPVNHCIKTRLVYTRLYQSFLVQEASRWLHQMMGDIIDCCNEAWVIIAEVFVGWRRNFENQRQPSLISFGVLNKCTLCSGELCGPIHDLCREQVHPQAKTWLLSSSWRCYFYHLEDAAPDVGNAWSLIPFLQFCDVSLWMRIFCSSKIALVTLWEAWSDFVPTEHVWWNSLSPCHKQQQHQRWWAFNINNFHLPTNCWPTFLWFLSIDKKAPRCSS